MKIQAIKKLCMEMCAFNILHDMHGRQLLCDGRAAWPVEGIMLTRSMIPALFDIDAKKLEKIMVREGPVPDEERFSLEPMPGEEELKDLGLIWDNGKFVRVLSGSDRLLFIDNALTKPAENKEGEFCFSVRKHAGRTPIVACYADMLVGALIMPMVGKEIMERLEKISCMPLNVFWHEDEEEKIGI